MTYSNKVEFGEDTEIEVSGDDPQMVVNLMNRATKKFFEGYTVATKDM